jgi:hypothetical protein
MRVLSRAPGDHDASSAAEDEDPLRAPLDRMEYALDER